MKSHIGQIAGLVAVATLLGSACLAAQSSTPLSDTQKLQQALSNRLPGKVDKIELVEPLRSLVERLWAYQASYDQAVNDDGDLASSTVAPVQVAIFARVDQAFQFASKGRLIEAKDALADADRALATQGVNLGSGQRRELRVNIELCRGAIAGDEARRGAPAEAAARLVEARTHYQAALDLASSRADEASGGGVIASNDVIVIDAAMAARANAESGRQRFGDIIARPMSEAEIFAVLTVRARYGLAQVMFSAGDLVGAQSANAAALAFTPRGEPAWLTVALLRQKALLAASHGQVTEAIQGLKDAATVVKEVEGGSRYEARLLRERAEIEAAAGKTGDATADHRASFDILADQSDGVWPTAADVGPYLKLLGPYAAAGDKDAIAQFFAAASVATETETASTLNDVAARFASADTEAGRAIRQLQSAREEVHSADARRERLHNLPRGQASAGDIAAAEDEYQAARVAEKQASEAVALKAGSRAGAVLSPRANLADVQAVLRTDETYVRFIFLDDGAGYVLAATKTAAKLAPLGASRADIDRMVTQLRASTTPHKTSDASDKTSDVVDTYSPILAENLYRDLFEGVAALLGPSRELIIEPSGPLYSLPFIALVTAAPDNQTISRILASGGHDYRGVAWLGRDKAVVLSVSSGAFVRLRAAKPSTAPLPILAFANPTSIPAPDTAVVAEVSLHRAETEHLLNASDPGVATEALSLCGNEARQLLSFPTLQDSQTEAATAVTALKGDSSALVVGDGFTDVGVERDKDLNRYKVLLFSTHAALPDQTGSRRCWPQPLLVTSHAASPDSEGVLDTLAISNLQLNADLVVLSACNTANTAGNSGEALGGLAQAFILAGSRGLVVTHWEIPSAAASNLVSTFFKSMGAGTPPTRALMDAERTLMDDDKRSHPYYWAAFTSVSAGG